MASLHHVKHIIIILEEMVQKIHVISHAYGLGYLLTVVTCVTPYHGFVMIWYLSTGQQAPACILACTYWLTACLSSDETTWNNIIMSHNFVEHGAKCCKNRVMFHVTRGFRRGHRRIFKFIKIVLNTLRIIRPYFWDGIVYTFRFSPLHRVYLS